MVEVASIQRFAVGLAQQRLYEILGSSYPQSYPCVRFEHQMQLA